MRNRIILYISIFLIILLFTPLLFSQIKGESWEYSYYKEYNFKEFKDYAPANSPIDVNNIDYKLLHSAIFYETNRMREKHDLPVFKHSVALEKAAYMHSKDMVDKNFFNHINPYDSSKRTPFDRMSMFGVDEGYTAENIATTFAIQYESGEPVVSFDDIPPHTYITCAEYLVEGWMNSQGHRANILDSNYIYLGCGAYYYTDDIGMFKATQNFGSVVPDDSDIESNKGSYYTFAEKKKDNKFIYLENMEKNLYIAFPFDIDSDPLYIWDYDSNKWIDIEIKNESNDDIYQYLVNDLYRLYIAYPKKRRGIVYIWDYDNKKWIKFFSL